MEVFENKFGIPDPKLPDVEHEAQWDVWYRLRAFFVENRLSGAIKASITLPKLLDSFKRSVGQSLVLNTGLFLVASETESERLTRERLGLSRTQFELQQLAGLHGNGNQ